MVILKNENINSIRLCKHLEQKLKIKLPEKGYLAGQSVASAFFELSNSNLNPVYNDVDIFHDFPAEFFDKKYFEDTRRKRFINNKKIVQKHIFEERSHGDKDYKEQNIRNENQFSISNSKRIDLFNFIKMEKNTDELKIESLIETFDMNCTKIGIDLKTKRLYISRDFIDFMKFKKLLITDYGLPYHNVLRYFKKLNDLEIRSSFDEKVLEINNYAISIDNLIHQKKEMEYPKMKLYVKQPPAFGLKYKEMFNCNEKIKDHYYICNDMSYNEANLFKLIPKKPIKILDDDKFYNNISNEMKMYNKNVFKEIRLLKYLKDSFS
jgi:hypothetical protein